MDRHFLILFLAAICTFSFLSHSILRAEETGSNSQISTQEQAAEIASKCMIPSPIDEGVVAESYFGVRSLGK